MSEGGKPEPVLSMEGATALLIDAAGTRFDDACQQRLWALATALKAFPGVNETVPGMNNLMVTFDPLALDPEQLEAGIRRLWESTEPDSVPGQIVEIPVSYGGAFGEDLADIASQKGMSPDEVIAVHSGATYSVAAVGAMPGFVYLSGLPPVLATPRRANPRMEVKVGSVIIGGQQAGIMPISAPSGWHILGHTSFPLFDPMKDPPAAFQPGDRIRFVVKEVL